MEGQIGKNTGIAPIEAPEEVKMNVQEKGENETKINATNDEDNNEILENMRERQKCPADPPVVYIRKRFFRRAKEQDGAGGSSSKDPISEQEGDNEGSKGNQGENAEKPKSVKKPGPSQAPLPDKEILEYIIAQLEELDYQGYFAKPIPADKVEEYAKVIKNPMDFETLRKKLAEGSYHSFNQFESDVNLIFSNAMKFNSRSTVCYKQAHLIGTKAKTIFASLKGDPTKLEKRCMLKKKRENLAGAAKPKKKTGKKTGGSASATAADHVSPKGVPENTDDHKGDDDVFQRRYTWEPKPTLLEECNSLFSTDRGNWGQLLPGNGGIGYKESLMRFAKGLGPVAEKVAQRKLLALDPTIPIFPPPAFGGIQNQAPPLETMNQQAAPPLETMNYQTPPLQYMNYQAAPPLDYLNYQAAPPLELNMNYQAAAPTPLENMMNYQAAATTPLENMNYQSAALPLENMMNYQAAPLLEKMNYQATPLENINYQNLNYQAAPLLERMNYQAAPLLGNMNYQAPPPLDYMNYQAASPFGQYMNTPSIHHEVAPPSISLGNSLFPGGGILPVQERTSNYIGNDDRKGKGLLRENKNKNKDFDMIFHSLPTPEYSSKGIVIRDNGPKEGEDLQGKSFPWM